MDAANAREFLHRQRAAELGVHELSDAFQPAWRRTRPEAHTTPLDDFEAEPLQYQGRSFRDGFWVNVLNPKVSLFYLALVPQFVGDRNAVAATYVVLTGIHVAFGGLWFTLLSLVLGRIRPWLLSTATRRAVSLVAGLIMIGIAVRAAMHS